MKRQGKAAVLLLTFALAAGGCGEKPITMTPEEESMIVHYAAHVVSKFNTRQPDGLCPVRTEEPQTEQPVENTETASELATETDANTGTADGQTAATEQPKEEPVTTLTDALGLDGISAEFTGAEVKASYTKPDYYALDASEGNTFVIVHISLSNTTDSDVSCDMLSDARTFTALVNDNVKVKARTTILLNDLGTYQGTVPAKESVDTVLLFEVPAEEVSEVGSIRLTVERDGTKLNSEL